MTVTEKRSRKLISGSGWVNPLTHDFELENETHLKVYADETLLVLGVDYHISGVLDEDGYSVTINNTALWNPTTWVLSVEPPINQQSDVSLGGAFGARYEVAVDALTRRVQRLRDLADRSIKMPVTTALGTEYTLGAPVPGAAVGWDETGTSLVPVSQSTADLQALVDQLEDLADIVVSNGPGVFDTVAQATAHTFPVGTRTFQTRGYASLRDGGGATYGYWDPADHNGNAYPETYLIANKVQNGDFLIDLYWTKPTGFAISASAGVATACTGDLIQTGIMRMAGFYDEISFRIYNADNSDPENNYLTLIFGSDTDGVKYSQNGLYTVRVLKSGSGGAVSNSNLIFRMNNFTGGLKNVKIRQVYKPVYGVLTVNFSDGTSGYFTQIGSINPKAMGAKGDGVTDDTLVLRDAQLYGAGLNIPRVLPDGDYVYTAWLTTYLGHAIDNVGFWGASQDCTKARLINKCQSTDYHMMTVRGAITPVANGEPLTVAAPAGSNKLRIASPAANYYGEANVWLALSDPSQIIYNQTSGLACAIVGEMVQVSANESSGLIRLRSMTQFSYTTSATVRKLRRPQGLTLQDVSVVQLADGDAALRCQPIVTIYAERVRVNRCHFQGFQTRILDLNDYTHDYRISDTTGFDIKDNTTDPAYFMAVGVGSTDGLVENTRIDKCRHFITSGGVSTDMEAARCTLINCWSINSDASGFDSHAGGIRNMEFINCHAFRRDVSGLISSAFNGIHGYQIRSRFCRLLNCSATGYWFGVNGVQGSDLLVQDFDARACMVGVAVVDCPRTIVNGLRVFGDHAQAVLVDCSGIVTPMERVVIDRVEVYGTTKGANAYATITLSSNPSDSDNVIVNGFTYTFKTTPGAGSGTSTDIQIGATREDTATNLATAIRLSAFSAAIVDIISGNVSGNVVGLFARQPGTGGNAYTLTKSGAAISISGATFTHGGDNLAAVYYSYWDDSFSVGSVRLPVGSTVPKFGGVIPDAYAYGYTSITATATIKATPHTILADTTAGAITLNLPTAASMKGQRLRAIKTAGANTLTWDGNGAETIDGSATKAVTTNAAIISNGTAWFTESAA